MREYHIGSLALQYWLEDDIRIRSGDEAAVVESNGTFGRTTSKNSTLDRDASTTL